MKDTSKPSVAELVGQLEESLQKEMDRSARLASQLALSERQVDKLRADLNASQQTLRRIGSFTIHDKPWDCCKTVELRVAVDVDDDRLRSIRYPEVLAELASQMVAAMGLRISETLLGEANNALAVVELPRLGGYLAGYDGCCIKRDTPYGPWVFYARGHQTTMRLEDKDLFTLLGKVVTCVKPLSHLSPSGAS
jgi:hypothetical protein